MHHRHTPEAIPLWFERLLVIATAGVLAFGSFGLLLAVIGVYHFSVVLPVGLVLTAGLSWVAWPEGPPRSTGRRVTSWAAAAMCVVAIGSATWNGLHAGHHVAIGRDPGVYAVTAKWIATRGNLVMTTGEEWSSKSSGTDTVFGGSYAEGPNHSQFQFDHLTSVLLAEGDGLAGDRLLFRMPAILAALGLLAVYAVGCRLIRRPWITLAATAGLAISLPELNVGREILSEPAVQLFLWSGIGLVAVAWERRRLGPAFLGARLWRERS